MRITNKIIQRNNLSNINVNKLNEDKLSTQHSTQKKVNRPSDDPVVAIRALRLRSSVTEVTQYYSKNIPDAQSWLEVTEDALVNLTEVLKSLISKCNKGSNSYLETEDRQIILEEMKSLADEIYATGDADYAGRYVFTGYRTDTSLSFTEEENKYYDIVEQLGTDSVDTVTKVDTDRLLDINSSNFMEDDVNVVEQDVDSVTCHRIRLAYNDCVGDGEAAPSITIRRRAMDADGVTPKVDENGKPVYEEVTFKAQVKHSYENPYAEASGTDHENALIFVPETGELLMGDAIYDQVMSVQDDPATVADEGEIRVRYQKEHWEKGDLRPEHYFACTAYPGDPEKELKYNEDYLTDDPERQNIEYDVGFNQRIRINSTADECFQHGIGREVDDIVTAMQDVMDLEKIRSTLTGLISENEGNEEAIARLTTQLDSVDKALTLAKEKEQSLFEAGITAFQGYMDDANLCITNCGTRSSKLSLVENRMKTQKTTFETLKSTNEDVDIAEVEIQLESATQTYTAALLATGKVMQSTLLNYI